MTHTGFVVNFLDLPTQFHATADDFRDFFENYNPKNWLKGGNGGVIKYFSNNGKIFTCLIAHSVEYGILLQFGSIDKVNKKRGVSQITIDKTKPLDEFVDIGSDEIFSIGCFVSPNKAWPLFESFLENPTVTPSSDLLTDASQVPLPEIFD